MENPHTTITPDEQLVPWYDGKFYKSVLAVFAVMRWIIVAVVFTFGIYMYQRDVNAQQTIDGRSLKGEIENIKQTIEERKAERDKQMEKVLTRDVFEAYYKALNERLDRIERTQDAILQQRQTLR